MQRTAIVALSLAFAAAPSAWAAERTDDLRRAARNALGILEYCRGQDFVGDQAVLAQRRAVDALAPATAPAVGDMEEADGRLGYLAFERRQARFVDSASAQGNTLAEACAGRALGLTGR